MRIARSCDRVYRNLTVAISAWLRNLKFTTTKNFQWGLDNGQKLVSLTRKMMLTPEVPVNNVRGQQWASGQI